MIPKVLHRIWVGGPMPEAYRIFGEKWKTINPEWEIREWGNDDFGWLQNQDLFDNAEQYVPADAVGQFRSDVARYEILLKHGGVYVDCDVEPLLPFAGFLNNDGFAGWEEDGVFVGNTVLGSVPGNPLFSKMVDALPGSAKANKGRAATWISGPRVFTRIVSESGLSLTIFPQSYFFPYSYKELRDGFDPGQKTYSNAFSVHHWGHQRSKRGRPLVAGGNGELSVAIMAHPKRKDWVPALEEKLPNVRTVWDRANDRWDTGSRSLLAHTDAQWHMVVQDDALLPPDFYEGVKRMLTYVPPSSPVGLYYGATRPRPIETANLVARAKVSAASFIVHNGPWWGVGIVLPSAHIRSVVEWGDKRKDIPNYDRRIARWYNQEGIECWYPQPSLIEHRHGAENPSLVPGRNGTNRRAHRFVGPRSALQVDWTRPVVRSEI